MSFEKSKIEIAPGASVEQDKSAKEIAWEQKRQEIDQIVDLNGRRIDGGIKETVVALNINELPTSNSCEGHIDRGLPFPFVKVEAERKPRWRYEGQRELFQEVAKEKNIPLDKLEREHLEWDVNVYEDVENEMWRRINEQADTKGLKDTEEYREWKEKNEEIFETAQKLFDEYRKNIEAGKIDSDTEIVMEGSKKTGITFRPKSGFARVVDGLRYVEERSKQNWELSEEERAELLDKIKKRRVEMQRFTEFLRNSYFEEESAQNV